LYEVRKNIKLAQREMERLIINAGYCPKQRDQQYEIMK